MKFTPNQLLPLLRIAIAQQSVPFVLGAPGIGKSAIMRQIAQDLDAKLFVLSANLLADKSDLTGVTKTQLEDGSYAQMFYPHMTIQEAISNAKANPDKLTILFLDEVNRAPEDVTTGLMSLSTERKIGNVPLPENISIVLAGNDSGNVNSVDSATLSRSVIYHLVPSATELLDSPAGQKFDNSIVAWLKSNPQDVFSQPIEDDSDDNNGSVIMSEMGEDFDQFTTPRTIEKLSDFIKAAKAEGIWSDLVASHTAQQSGLVESSDLQGVVYAHIGQTPAANRLIEQIAKTSSTAGNKTQVQEMPDSVLRTLEDTFDDPNETISQLRDEFIIDEELAIRTLTGIFTRGTSQGVADFKINPAVVSDVINVVFEVVDDAQSKLISVLTSTHEVNDMAVIALGMTSNASAKAFELVLSALINEGIIKKA